MHVVDDEQVAHVEGQFKQVPLARYVPAEQTLQLGVVVVLLQETQLGKKY